MIKWCSIHKTISDCLHLC